MSNIDRAVAGLQAELKYAQEGKAYYQQQVTKLEIALVQLGGIGQVAVLDAKHERTLKVLDEKKPTKARWGRKGGDLPFTGGDFWPSLVTTNPQSGRDVLAAARAKLRITTDKVQDKKLQNRMVFALNALVKAGTIKDSGSGRERRFFRI